MIFLKNKDRVSFQFFCKTAFRTWRESLFISACKLGNMWKHFDLIFITKLLVWIILYLCMSDWACRYVYSVVYSDNGMNRLSTKTYRKQLKENSRIKSTHEMAIFFYIYLHIHNWSLNYVQFDNPDRDFNRYL